MRDFCRFHPNDDISKNAIAHTAIFRQRIGVMYPIVNLITVNA